MRVEEFSDQYELAASAYGLSPDELRDRDDLQAQPLQRWLAIVNGTVAGAVSTWLRPDRRNFLMFACPDPAAYASLTHAVLETLGGRLYTTVDADETEAVEALQAAGFTQEMVAERLRVRFDAALAKLRRASTPPGFSIQAADTVDEGRLFTLDNTVRQDVPGTDGWRGDREWFREEIAESPPFDPSAYLVGVDDHNGEYVGLVRIWRNANGPRFGLIGVVRQYRNTTIAAALIRWALSAAAQWGHPTFTTEACPANGVIHQRLKRVGAESMGRNLQLVRRRP
ncbi:MAG: GNAT family N-acetyltransferase [Actinomycetota bacterium]|nr:GNAT family N-acetyltransferase [Actinomycetota bacterium]